MADTFLERTHGNSSPSGRKGTVSVWVKRAKLGSTQYILGNYNNANNYGYLRFNSDDSIVHYSNWDSDLQIATSAKYRDTNGWYHIVLSVDTTQSTASDRLKLYVNGVQQDVTLVSGSQNDTNYLFQASASGGHRIGSQQTTQDHFDGCMSHFHFIDGTAYDASAFGETDATTGEWKIKTSPSVTYGSQGYFMLKDDNSLTDQSGEGNNFIVGNGTLTKTEDCPSNVFATFNTLFPKQAPSTTNMGNTRIDESSSAWKSKLTTIGAYSGKYYAEFKAGTISSGSPYKYNQIGIVNEDVSTGGTMAYIGDNDYGWGLNWNGQIDHSNTGQGGSYTSFATGDIISVAMDLDNHKVYWRKNNDAWMNSGDPTSGSTGTGAQSLDTGKFYFFAASVYNSECFANFGNGYFGTTAVSSAGTNASGIGIFEYDVPTGYTALSTKGLNE
jgi:hypothetical protein